MHRVGDDDLDEPLVSGDVGGAGMVSGDGPVGGDVDPVVPVPLPVIPRLMITQVDAMAIHVCSCTHTTSMFTSILQILH